MKYYFEHNGPAITNLPSTVWTSTTGKVDIYFPESAFFTDAIQTHILSVNIHSGDNYILFGRVISTVYDKNQIVQNDFSGVLNVYCNHSGQLYGVSKCIDDSTQSTLATVFDNTLNSNYLTADLKTRTFAGTYTTTTITNYFDIVTELGVYFSSNSTGTITIKYQFGDNATGVGDLPYSNGSVSSGNPWLNEIMTLNDPPS